MRDFAVGLWCVLLTSRPAVWLHIHWHGGRPCPRAVRQLADEEWAKSLLRAAQGR